MKLKLACPFVRYEPICEEIAAEFNITYIPDKNDFENLIDFCQTYSKKRVNVYWRDNAGIDIKSASALNKTCDNVYFCLEDGDLNKLAALKERSCKYYFAASNAARSFRELEGQIKLGVSDVYISDDLCYCLKDVRDYCHKHDVQVRVILNRVMSSLLAPDDKTVFFWRPEDIDLAALYYDVAEFDCGNLETYDFKAMKVLYRVFFEDKRWVGNLQEVVENLPFFVYNKSLVQDFNHRKINCRYRCVSENSSCSRCPQFLDIMQSLGEKQIAFKTKKGK